jgi:hypothetical protein
MKKKFDFVNIAGNAFNAITDKQITHEYKNQCIHSRGCIGYTTPLCRSVVAGNSRSK